LKSTLYFFVVQTTDLLDDNGVPSFLAYSASGNVSGNLVYVNYGRQQDYKRLRDYNISLNGSIAMIRYGRIFRGSKVCGVATMFILFAILRHKNLPTLYQLIIFDSLFQSRQTLSDDDFERKSKIYSFNCLSCFVHIVNCKMTLFFAIFFPSILSFYTFFLYFLSCW
jgi:hypothetical protein